MIKLLVHVWQKAVCVNQRKVKKQKPSQMLPQMQKTR